MNPFSPLGDQTNQATFRQADKMQELVGWIVLAVGGLVLLILAVNMTVVWRSIALQNQPLPDVPGPLGTRLATASQSLVYFFSPGCAACRSMTPHLQRLSAASPDVHVVDVSSEPAVARALRVAVTPSILEIKSGRIARVHVGPLRRDTLARFEQQYSETREQSA
jgi:thioredoxin 1